HVHEQQHGDAVSAAPVLLSDLPAPKTRIPIPQRLTAFAVALAAALGAGIYVAGYYQAPDVIQQTRTVQVERNWGTADQSLPASQVNPQLAELGITTCDFYASKRTLVCH